MAENKTENGTAVIELRDIHKSYGNVEVIKGVDLKAHKGDVVVLIGSSGSGKSTLLRCVNLLETAQGGDIIIEGEPVVWKEKSSGRQPADADQVRKFRTGLSMVFQQFNLWSHLTIFENITEAPISVLGEDRDVVEKRARALLAKVGITEQADKYPSQLSGGQQQRAAIARPLCMEPEAMLFDEPTSALDPCVDAPGFARSFWLSLQIVCMDLRSRWRGKRGVKHFPVEDAETISGSCRDTWLRRLYNAAGNPSTGCAGC